MTDQEKAIREALSLLGPNPPECCGCRYEWQEAIKVLTKAIQPPDSENVFAQIRRNSLETVNQGKKAT